MRPTPIVAILSNSTDSTTHYFTSVCFFGFLAKGTRRGGPKGGPSKSPAVVIVETLSQTPCTPRLGRHPLLPQALVFDTVRRVCWRDRAPR